MYRQSSVSHLGQQMTRGSSSASQFSQVDHRRLVIVGNHLSQQEIALLQCDYRPVDRLHKNRQRASFRDSEFICLAAHSQVIRQKTPAPVLGDSQGHRFATMQLGRHTLKKRQFLSAFHGDEVQPTSLMKGVDLALQARIECVAFVQAA